MTRTAYGISPEELSLQDAAIDGARAGQKGHGREMCTFDPSTPEYKAWDDARLQAIAARLAGGTC